jgi:hypothetical protein
MAVPVSYYAYDNFYVATIKGLMLKIITFLIIALYSRLYVRVCILLTREMQVHGFIILQLATSLIWTPITEEHA